MSTDIVVNDIIEDIKFNSESFEDLLIMSEDYKNSLMNEIHYEKI